MKNADKCNLTFLFLDYWKFIEIATHSPEKLAPYEQAEQQFDIIKSFDHLKTKLERKEKENDSTDEQNGLNNFNILMKVLNPELKSMLNLDWLVKQVENEKYKFIYEMYFVTKKMEGWEALSQGSSELFQSLPKISRKKDAIFSENADSLSCDRLWNESYELNRLDQFNNLLVRNLQPSEKSEMAPNIISYAFSEWVHKNGLLPEWFDNDWLAQKETELVKLASSEVFYILLPISVFTQLFRFCRRIR
jgi:hypothetical protein